MAATGLLDGKRATTHWGSAERFREKYPKVKWMPELMVTEDRGSYCGGGVHAALDLSLYLVEKFCGHDVAVQSAKALLIETPRAWQAGFAIVPLKTEHSNDSISSAQEWLHQNFHKSFSLEAPARRVGMSLRNFVRRFKQATGDSPLMYLQKLRIAAAKRLLESDHRTMQEISDAVGYQDEQDSNVQYAIRCPPSPVHTSFGPGNSDIRFSFVDITNLRSPGDEHVSGLEIHFLAPDHINITFQFTSNGKDAIELVDLCRNRRAPPGTIDDGQNEKRHNMPE